MDRVEHGHAGQRGARAAGVQVRILAARGLMMVEAPAIWKDDLGRIHKTSVRKGRLSFKTSSCGGALLQRFVMLRDGFTCAYCGVRAREPRVWDGTIPPIPSGSTWPLLMDHVISVRNGGSNHPDNLVTSCVSCNARKVTLVDARRGAQ